MEYAQEREKCCVTVESVWVRSKTVERIKLIVGGNEEVDLPCNQVRISLFNMTGERMYIIESI